MGVNPEAQTEAKPGTKAKTPADLTPRIARQAYKLYEEQGRTDGAAVQNWAKAASEIRKDVAKAEPPRDTEAVPTRERTIGR